MIQPWTIEDVESTNRNKLVVIFLTTSYIYYVRPELNPIISDELFDKVCRDLLHYWHEIEHQHKHLIDYGNLIAGTAFNLQEHDYPTVTRVVAVKMSENV
jgi:hypothetical protein